MNAPTATAKNPEIAGISGCLRTSRQTATAAPATSAAISAGCSVVRTLTTMNTARGRLDATMPATPPICSMTVGVLRSGRSDPGSGGLVTLLLRTGCWPPEDDRRTRAPSLLERTAYYEGWAWQIS